MDIQVKFVLLNSKQIRTNSKYTATVVVTSDTCFKQPKKDQSGDYVVNCLKSMKFQQVNKIIVPDDREAISRRVKTVAEISNNILVITVGGTGLCPRDVTPEATSALYDKNCPGISTALLLEGLKHSPHAALSRLTAGIYSHCLIINFPGKTKACIECFGCLSKILQHALDQVTGNLVAVEETHIEQAQPLRSADDKQIEQAQFFKTADDKQIVINKNKVKNIFEEESPKKRRKGDESTSQDEEWSDLDDSELSKSINEFTEIIETKSHK